MNWLSGNKTYLGAIAFGIGGILLATGVIKEDLWNIVWPLIAGWTGISIRHAIAKGR